MSDEQAYRDGKVVLKDAEGNLYHYEPRELAEGLPEGLAPVDERELAQSEAKQAQEEELHSFATKSKVAVRGVIESLTGPVAWAVTHALPGEFESVRSKEQIARNKEEAQANPFTSFIGSVTGQIAALKGFGIAGAAEEATAGIGNMALRAGARGAIEGSTLGLLGAAEDPAATAQHVLASGGFGAILGGGLGMGMGAAASRLSRILGRAESPLTAAVDDGAAVLRAEEKSGILGEVREVGAHNAADRALETEAEENPNLGGALKRNMASVYHKATAALTDTDESLLKEVGPFGIRTVEAKQAVQKLPELINRSAIEMQQTGNELEQNTQKLLSRVRVNAEKEENLRRLAGDGWATPERTAQARALAQSAAELTEGTVAKMGEWGEAGTNVSRFAKSDTRRYVRELMQTVSETAKPAEDAIGDYMKSNRLKQSLDRTIKSLRRDAANPNLGISYGEKTAMGEVANMLQETADQVRKELESTTRWGDKVASAQKEINAIWHGEGETGGAIRGMKEWRRHAMYYVEDDYHTGLPRFELDPGKVAGIMRTGDTAEGKLRADAANLYFDSVGKLLRSVGDRYELEGADKALLDKTLGQLDAMKGKFAAVRDQAELAGKFQQLEAAQSRGAVLGAAVPTVGAVLGGPIGAAAGFALQHMLAPANAARAAIKMSQATNRIQRLVGSTGRWLTSGAAPLESVGGKVKAGVRYGGLAASIAHFRGTHDSDRKAYDDRVKTVLAASPADIGQHIDGMPPAVQMAAGQTVTAGLAFLKSQIPPYAASPTLMAPTRKVIANEADRQKFAKAWATVADPSTAIRDLKQGRLTPVQVKALQQVYPSIYEDLRATVVQGIANADRKGNRIPIYQKQQLDTLLDLGGAGDPAFSHELAQRMQQAAASQQQPKPQKAPKISKSTMSFPMRQFGGRM